MANNTKEIKDRENLMLSGHLSEIPWEPKSELDISKDLFKYSDPNKIVDAFEQQVGIKTPTVKPVNQAYKCVFLKPSDDEDRELLQKFYNNPERYQVLNRSDNWTHSGNLIIFLEYFENLDAKAEQEITKEEVTKEEVN